MSLLRGHQLKISPKINQAVDGLVSEIIANNSLIQGVAPVSESHRSAGQALLDKIGSLRGRPLHYPYVGTGAGRGPYVELEDGSIKLDLINGIGIHIMGHSHPRVLAACLRGAMTDIVMQGNLQPNIEYIQLTEKLVQIASKGSRLKHAWFSTCGTMANENALKMARQKVSPARMIITFKNAFAGRSTMMAEVTDNPSYKVGLPEYNEVLRLPFYDKRDPKSSETTFRLLKEHVAVHGKGICAFAFEPMLGEGGYQAAPREFFVPLLEFCKDHQIPIWADEVQTFTRTGEFFAFQTLDIGKYVDICTIAKTAQLGATLYTEEFNPKPGLIAGTFSGNSSSMHAALEIFAILEEGYLGSEGRIQKIHRRFIEGLNKLNFGSCKDKASDAGGMGLMIAFTPHDGKKESVDIFLKKLFNNGVIGFACGKDPVRARFLVPAIIEDKDVDIALSIIEKTLLEGI